MISAPVVEYLKKGIFTILGLIVAVYLFIILMTYTGNDPSWSHISSDMTTINNMGGAMGAWLSDLLYTFFGFGAWWLLVFIVYESILIWWDNKPTFWLLRLVAYVFLILSASALFAQMVALIQQVADPVSSGLKGVAGGIIGLELQARLAQLLSTWGSLLFLTAFVLITATFAFNIHWLTLYRKLTGLTWLGSGVSNDDPQTNPYHEHSLIDQDSEQTTEEHNNDSLQKSHEQLDLELPDHAADGSTHTTAESSRFSHVLTEFLAKSELGNSVKEAMATAEMVATKSSGDRLQPATANANASANVDVSDANSSSQNLSDSSMPTTAITRKVEPSFAWNDSGMVDDLLAHHSATEQGLLPASHSSLQKPAAVDHQNITDDEVIEDSVLSTSYEPDIAYFIDEEAAKDGAVEDSLVESSFEDNTAINDVDTLADAWLSEHQPVATIAVETEDTAELAQPLVDPLAVTKRKLAIVTQAPAAVSAISVPADMTPTNTPPENPQTLPTSVKPTISFAVPDGDASNHISDMMPEDNSPVQDDDVLVMPDIHDDDAFSKRSRAMQTAEYRGSLSVLPELSILDKPDPNREPSYTIAELEQLSELLEIKLQEFNVKAEVVQAIPGPVVTRFEVDLAPGIKASKVTGISRDLARSLSMASLRVVEVIPGKPYIGIEVPNKQREMVRLIELLNTEKYKDPNAQISMAMGKDIGGKPIITDLARAPHMLVAGTTGSGKSVLVNSMLLSMLLKYTPNELRLILIDPKQLELANYNDIPHLLTPVVTDMTEAASALSWCVAEMERRYQLMSLLKVRKLNEFNKKVIAAEKAGKPMLDPLWRPNDNVSISQAPKLKTLPMIVIVADEFADMIMQVGKQAEELITRLAQKSRASGIHLMLATQRPSVDVITGLIKANIPVRAALRVNSKVDSRTILDSGGAEDMLGNGDMLFLGPGQIEPDRVHGAYVSDEEVNRVCDAWRERGAPDYIDNMSSNFELSSPGSGSSGTASGEDDDLYNEAVAFIMETRKVSASSIQRKFSIGYNRAARIVDSMEEAGLVSSMGKSGKRELLM